MAWRSLLAARTTSMGSAIKRLARRLFDDNEEEEEEEEEEQEVVACSHLGALSYGGWYVLC